MGMNEWIQDLKVGDEVVVSNRHTKHINKIDRITKTQIIIGCRRFRRSDGDLIGRNQWNFTRLRKASKDLMDEIRLKDLQYELTVLRDHLVPADSIDLVKKQMVDLQKVIDLARN